MDTISPYEVIFKWKTIQLGYEVSTYSLCLRLHLYTDCIQVRENLNYTAGIEYFSRLQPDTDYELKINEIFGYINQSTVKFRTPADSKFNKFMLANTNKCTCTM